MRKIFRKNETTPILTPIPDMPCKKAKANYDDHCGIMVRNSKDRCNLVRQYLKAEPKCDAACLENNLDIFGKISKIIEIKNKIIKHKKKTKKEKAAARAIIKKLKPKLDKLPVINKIKKISQLDETRKILEQTRLDIVKVINEFGANSCRLPLTSFSKNCKTTKKPKKAKEAKKPKKSKKPKSTKINKPKKTNPKPKK
jgi:hypothetical protein